MSNTTTSVPGVCVSVDDARAVDYYRDMSPWLPLVRRLQSAGRWRRVEHRRGHSVVKVTVFVDEHGNPVNWLEPDVRRIEPGSREVSNAAMEALAEE